MLITFEGIDASGKTTQIRLLEKALTAAGQSVLVTRQPGGTEIGTEIRRLLLNPKHAEMVPETEVLLYLADRLQHIRQIIAPALQQRRIVLCDRYHDATLAYQGGGRQLDLSWASALQQQFILVPDLTLWFDISVACSVARLKARNQADATENCRLEREDQAFFQRIRQTYQALCDREPQRFIRIEAEDTVTAVHDRVLKTVRNRLP